MVVRLAILLKMFLPGNLKPASFARLADLVEQNWSLVSVARHRYQCNRAIRSCGMPREDGLCSIRSTEYHESPPLPHTYSTVNKTPRLSGRPLFTKRSLGPDARKLGNHQGGQQPIYCGRRVREKSVELIKVKRPYGGDVEAIAFYIQFDQGHYQRAAKRDHS